VKRNGFALLFCLTMLFLAPATLGAERIDALRIVPGDSVAVGSVNLGALRSSPLSGRIFAETDKMAADGDAGRFLADAGFDPAKDVDVVTVAVRPRQEETSGDVLVVAEGRFDAQRIIAALVARGAETAGTNAGAYYMMPEKENPDGKRGAVAFPARGYAVIGSENAVKGALNAVARGGGFRSTTLGRQLRRIDPAAQAWVVIDVERLARLDNASGNPNAVGVLSAVKRMSHAGLWTIDTGRALRIGGVALSDDAETRELLEDAIRGALASARLAAQDKDPDLVKILRQSKVTRDREGVSVEVSVPARYLEKMRGEMIGTAAK
jgi:hypothetical protein